MEFGKKLRKIRNQLAMSIEEFALNLDVTPSQLKAWETGKIIPNFKTVNRIIAMLGFDYQEFFDDYSY